MISSSAGLKDSWTMVLHSWEFWKPVSNAMVRHLNKAGDDKHSNYCIFFRDVFVDALAARINVECFCISTCHKMSRITFSLRQNFHMRVAPVVGAKNVLF